MSEVDTMRPNENDDAYVASINGDKGRNIFDITNKAKSVIYTNITTSNTYIEYPGNNGKSLTIIFRTPNEIERRNNMSYDINDKIQSYDDIILVFDFQILSLQLQTESLKKIICIFYEKKKSNLSVVIKNCFFDSVNMVPIEIPNTILKLKKLEITDELYSISNNLTYLFSSIKTEELILRQFKFNSKKQLFNFCEHLYKNKIECKKLTLDDFCIELIIKNKEDDDSYKDLDIYFTYSDSVITLNNYYIDLNSLTLRDCPLFVISGNMFKDIKFKEKEFDIDENSILNPSIITKFKVKDGKFDLCFDLDSFKLKLSENKNTNNIDYIDYLTYILQILISFQRKDSKDYNLKFTNEDDEIKNIPTNQLHKLVFKNFDCTNLEYITGDDITFIEEQNWILSNEEIKKKKRLEKFKNELKDIKSNIPSVKELIFENCTNFFIQTILDLVVGDNMNQIREQNNNKKGNQVENQLDILKIKKCNKDYINLKKILTLFIGKLVLYDSPLIYGDAFPKEGGHLPKGEDVQNSSFGGVQNLVIKINSLDTYGKQNSLNTFKTYEILFEIFSSPKFNKNITFEMSALSNFMTFLAYKKYIKNPNYYNNSNDEENGDDNINAKEQVKGKDEGNYGIDLYPKCLQKVIIFGSKKYRDKLCSDAFNIEVLKNSTITLKNVHIRKSFENVDNLNYIYIKTKQEMKNSQTKNKILKKIDFGSDGFFIERDYKIFFSENQLEKVRLINVSFSNAKDQNLKEYDEEAFIGLISQTKSEKNVQINIRYPNYEIDYKTLNGILYKNHNYEDVGVFIRYLRYKFLALSELKDKPKKEEFEDKLKKMRYYFEEKFQKVFDRINSSIKELTILINNKNEAKELFCTFFVLKYFKEILNINNNVFEKISGYFLQDMNEKDESEFSEMNYYYTSPGEENLFKSKKIEYKNNIINIKEQNELE